MLTERLNTRNYTFFEKLKSVDYFLILIVMLIGAISVFAIYSTESGHFSFYTKIENGVMGEHKCDKISNFKDEEVFGYGFPKELNVIWVH